MGSSEHGSAPARSPLAAHDEFSLATLTDVESQNHHRRGGATTPDDSGLVEITAPQKMASAMSGSLVTSLLVTPLDVVRVRLQSQGPPARPAIDFSKLAITTTSLTPAQTAELGVTSCCREVFFAGGTADYCLAAPRIDGLTVSTSSGAPLTPPECAVEETQRRTFSSTIDGLRKIARNEGVSTLWRGLSPTLVMTVPANIIYFTGYEYLRFNRKSPLSRLNDAYAPLTAGSAARVLAVTAVGPIELIRTRMMAASGSSGASSLLDAFKGVREMVATSGYSSLWRGLTLTLWRDVPFSGLYWWGYESIRSRLTDLRERRHGHTLDAHGGLTPARRRSQSQENHTETLVDSFTAGALSGAFASIVTMPFDVGKTRTQIHQEGGSGAAPGQAPQERNMMRLLVQIFRTEGIAGLWKGWIPRTLKVAPACAIMISSYEVGKRAFRGVNERAQQRSEVA